MQGMNLRRNVYKGYTIGEMSVNASLLNANVQKPTFIEVSQLNWPKYQLKSERSFTRTIFITFTLLDWTRLVTFTFALQIVQFIPVEIIFFHWWNCTRQSQLVLCIHRHPRVTSEKQFDVELMKQVKKNTMKRRIYPLSEVHHTVCITK